MGILHFAPVGTSPGAVTSAMSYLKNEQEKFSGLGGQIIESVLLFSSPDVRDGTTIVNEYVENDYMSLRGQCKRGSFNIINVIIEFIQTEIATIMPSGSAVYCCIVDPNDYEDCFGKIAKATLKFSSVGKVGKHIWANLTGGTNVVNAALLQVTLLSGLIGRIYYTFLADQEYSKYLQPPTRDKTKFRWDDIPIFKTNFDENYTYVLKELRKVGATWCKDEDVLSRLKNAGIEIFRQMDLKTFRREFLNKLDGRELERQKYCNRLSPYGERIVDMIDDPLFNILIRRGELLTETDLKKLIADLEIEEIWSKP